MPLARIAPSGKSNQNGVTHELTTSAIGLWDNLRSMTFGLLSFGVFLMGFGEEETESESEFGVFNLRAVRGVTGDFLWGTSEALALPAISQLAFSMHNNKCGIKTIFR